MKIPKKLTVAAVRALYRAQNLEPIRHYVKLSGGACIIGVANCLKPSFLGTFVEVAARAYGVSKDYAGGLENGWEGRKYNMPSASKDAKALKDFRAGRARGIALRKALKPRLISSIYF